MKYYNQSSGEFGVVFTTLKGLLLHAVALSIEERARARNFLAEFSTILFT